MSVAAQQSQLFPGQANVTSIQNDFIIPSAMPSNMMFSMRRGKDSFSPQKPFEASSAFDLYHSNPYASFKINNISPQ
jgi:hypothetical protein